MGLDNGIFLKNVKREDIPPFVEAKWYEDECEIVYFRKCWGIRNAINSVLHLSSGECETQLDKEDIPAIAKILLEYTDPEYYKEYHDSIWEFKQALPNIMQCYMNLMWLHSMWDHLPGMTATWYDSF